MAVLTSPKIVSSRRDFDDSYTLKRYLATGGYEGLKKALKMNPYFALSMKALKMNPYSLSSSSSFSPEAVRQIFDMPVTTNEFLSQKACVVIMITT